MNSRTLTILSVVAAIAIAAGVWLAARQGSSGVVERAVFYPELAKQLDSIQAIRIHRSGDERAVEIARKNGGWGVAERSGYTADVEKLVKFLRELADAKVLEQKTSNPANYKSLGVEDVTDKEATGVRVELAGAPTAVNLIVGKRGPGSGSRYVRRVGESESWLIDADIDASSEPADWVAKDVLDISADRIQSASVTRDKQKPYTAAKASRADANFSVENLPKGKELISPSVANGFATALSGLTLSDVQPRSAFEGAKPNARATFRTFDGLILELNGWERDDKHYLAVESSSHDPAHAERFALPTATQKGDKAENKDGGDDAAQGEDNKSEDAAEASGGDDADKPNVAEEVKTISARTSGWVYEIPSYKYEQIFKLLDDLIS